jgi:hypothetical protein
MRFDRESLLLELRLLDLDQLRSLRVVLLWELGGFRGAATRTRLRATLSMNLASPSVRFGAALGSGVSGGRQVVVREDGLTHAAAYAAHSNGCCARGAAVEEWKQQAAMPSVTASWHLPVARQPKWPLTPALGTRAAEDALVDFIFDSNLGPGVYPQLLEQQDIITRWTQTQEWIACLSWNASQLSAGLGSMLAVRLHRDSHDIDDDEVEVIFALATEMFDRSTFWPKFLEWRIEMLETVAGVSLQKWRDFEAVAEREKQQGTSKVATAYQSKGRGQAKDDKREAECSQAQERERPGAEPQRQCEPLFDFSREHTLRTGRYDLPEPYH